MAITPILSDNLHALLHHLAESNDPLAGCIQAIIDAIALDPAVPSYSSTATDVSDSASAPGSAVTLSRGDHGHAHGNRAGGTTHAAATGSAAGFMSAAHYTKVEGVTAGATNTPLASTAPVAVTSAAAEVGDGTTAARNNHKHAVAQAGAGSEGLMSAAHYSKLDGLPANISPALTPATYTTITSITVDAYGRITAIAGT
jgi:hypothetical protein